MIVTNCPVLIAYHRSGLNCLVLVLPHAKKFFIWPGQNNFRCTLSNDQLLFAFLFKSVLEMHPCFVRECMCLPPSYNDFKFFCKYLTSFLKDLSFCHKHYCSVWIICLFSKLMSICEAEASLPTVPLAKYRNTIKYFYWTSKEVYTRWEWIRCIGWPCNRQCNSVVTW